MSQVNWFQVFVDILQAVISGIFVGVALYFLDERRAKRERRLSDFRIASNWSRTEPKLSLRNFDLTKVNLSGRNFVKADLERAIIADAGLWATNFTEANLRHVDFRKSRFVGGKLIKAIARGADFSKATITKRSDPDYEYLPDFTGAALEGAKFLGTRLNGVVMTNANLSRSNFSKAIVLDCDFTGANLTDSNWKKVKRIENCIWKDVIIDRQENFPQSLLEEIQRQNAKPIKRRKSEK